MPGKKWCEYCRINLPYSKKDIQNHEATRLHLQNKQKAIKFQRIKIRKQRSEKRQNQHEVMLGTANIPKAKKGSELQQQIASYRDSVYQEGKRAIHMMIAERTKGLYGAPIEYPQKQDLVLAQNYQQNNNDDGQQGNQEQEQNFEMWKIDICDKTGQPCFINRITKLVLYQPPKGYVLTQEQKQEWGYLKQICKQKVQVNPDAVVNISQWEQMPDQENYFTVNRAQQSDSDQQQQIDNKAQQHPSNFNQHQKYLSKVKTQTKTQPTSQNQKKTWKQELEQKLINNEISTNEVFEKFIQNEMKNSKTIKQKNQNLKKLIESGIEIRSRPTDELISECLVKQQVVGECKIEQKGKSLFKPRKKVQMSQKTFKLNDQKEFF